MDCADYLELLSAQLDGELTDGEERALSAHLETCPACRELARQLAGLHQDCSQLEELEAPGGFAQGVMEKIRGERRVLPLFRRPRVKTLAGLAACAVLCVGLYGAGQLERGQPALGAADSSASARIDSAESLSPMEQELSKQAADFADSLCGGASKYARDRDIGAGGQALEEGVVLTLERMPEGARALLPGDAAVTYAAGDPAYLFLTLDQIEQLETLAREQGIAASRSVQENGDGMCALVILEEGP